jgi:hypothetical protein
MLFTYVNFIACEITTDTFRDSGVVLFFKKHTFSFMILQCITKSCRAGSLNQVLHIA